MAVDAIPEQVLEAISAEVRRCTACRLCEQRTKAVPGEGALKSGIMFIGEGPGFHEDRQGRPFVGQAGKLPGGVACRRRLASRAGVHY